MIATEVLEKLHKVFRLSVDEVLKLQLLETQGHRLIAAGVTVWWNTPQGDRVRTTSQISAPGLTTIPDCTHYYSELMDDLDDMEASEFGFLTKALYFYTKKDGLHFHAFTRK